MVSLSANAQAPRCTSSAGTNLLGKWQSYVEGLVYGYNKGETIVEFRPDHTLIYWNKSKPQYLTYKVLSQSTDGMSAEVLVKNPPTGGSHIRHTQFTDGCRTQMSLSEFMDRNVRIKKDVVRGVRGKLEFLE